MRLPVLILLCLLSFCITAPLFSAGEINLQALERDGEGRVAIFVESSDPAIKTLARRAFSLHGGYASAPAVSAAFQIQLERASDRSVLLTVGSGQPYVEQLRQTLPGRDLQDAVLRACDLVVEATLQSPGFFAGKLAFVAKKREISEIYTSDLLFNRVTPLTRDRALVTGPKWSPDGQSIVYTTYFKTGFPDVYRIDCETGRREPIATYRGTNTGASFSPDGRRLAMSLSGTGNSEIYVSDNRGKDLQRLTSNKSLETSPSWSPDGRRLVYTSDAPGKPQLYEISANGGPARRLPTNISSYCSEPVWNPVDDSLIAFTASVSGGFQIALYNAKTRSSKILTQGGSSLEPVWMRDGRHLIFTRREGGHTGLMLLDSLTGQERALHKSGLGSLSSASFVY
jgi:TolB protein